LVKIREDRGSERNRGAPSALAREGAPGTAGFGGKEKGEIKKKNFERIKRIFENKIKESDREGRENYYRRDYSARKGMGPLDEKDRSLGSTPAEGIADALWERAQLLLLKNKRNIIGRFQMEHRREPSTTTKSRFKWNWGTSIQERTSTESCVWRGQSAVQAGVLLAVIVTEEK